MTDLISRGAKIRPRPLNTRRSEAVTVSLFIPPAVPSTTPHPRAFCTLPSFARIKRPRWQLVELNDRHLRSHGKIGGCGQSTCIATLINNSVFFPFITAMNFSKSLFTFRFTVAARLSMRIQFCPSLTILFLFC